MRRDEGASPWEDHGLTFGSRKNFGVVESVTEGSAAALAGLAVNDEITHVGNGLGEIIDSDGMEYALGLSTYNTSTSITVVRAK